jgi:hypothetical protein
MLLILKITENIISLYWKYIFIQNRGEVRIMKYIKNIFIFSCICVMNVHSSSYSRVDLPLENWTEKFSIDKVYQENIENFKKGNEVNFENIFQRMNSLAERLPTQNGARAYYLALITDRQRQVNLLQNSKKS